MSFGKKIESRFGKPHIGPQERIGYYGDLRPLLKTVSSEYDFGDYVKHEVKQNGYEDFNLVLTTTKDPFFVKCFADWRNEEACQRYLEMIQAAYAAGVRIPALYPNTQGNVLTTVTMNGVDVRLCTMKYLDEGNIFESKQPLNTLEKAEIVAQAAKIVSCDYEPKKVDDSWAIINMQGSYDKNKSRIDESDKPLIEDLLTQLKEVDIGVLPRSFVHGDIRSTNVMRHSDGHVYIIDFSVANWYPRIVELAVLFCDILFNPDHPQEIAETYQWTLSEYEKSGISFTKYELEVFPLFIKLAHAANVIGASSQDATNFISQVENNHWLELGRKGLHAL